MAGLVAYLVFVFAGVQWIVSVPVEDAATRGLVAYVVSGGAGVAAFAIAFGIRLRSFATFGFRRTKRRWVLVAIGAAVGLYGLNIVISLGYIALLGNDNPQTDLGYHAATSSGALSLLATIAAGAVLTPVGEELLFRGVIANALQRYGWWASVVGSAAIFALAHGINLIFVSAFAVGVVSAILLRKSGSIWPSIALHISYNLIGNLAYALTSG